MYSRLGVALAAIVLLGSVIGTAAPLKRVNQHAATLLSRYEAEILVQVLPEAHYCRAHGSEVGIEPEGEDEAYFQFWLFGKGPIDGASPNVGYFAVNRHTAEVWRTVPLEREVDPELHVIQELIRQIHGIGPAEISKYDAPPGLPTGEAQ